jgi:hypothetical protein
MLNREEKQMALDSRKEAQMEAEMAMLAETCWFYQRRRAYHDGQDCFGIAVSATIA